MARISKTDLKRKIKYLEDKEKEVRKELDRLKAKVEKYELIPKLRKQYEGKFFKYTNSFGSGETWPYYSFCKKVISGNEAITDSFQTTPYQSEFYVDKKEYLSLLQEEISKEEYDTALTEFMSKCQLMADNVFNLAHQ